MKLRFRCLALLLIALPAAAGERPLRSFSGTRAAGEPALAVLWEGGFLPDGPNVILAIWPDGHAVWSRDQVKGRGPYYAGTVPPAAIRRLLGELETEGLFRQERPKSY